MKQRDNAFCKMFKERNRLKVVLFLLSAFSVIAISLVFLSLSIGKPHMGIIIASDDQSWVVTMVDSNGLANQAGIEAGDHPVKINDQPAEIFLDKYRDAGTVFGQLITNLTVINESGQLKVATLEDSSISLNLIIEQISWLILILTFWLIGFFVFYKKPRDIAALLLCLCGLILGIALSANMAAERAVPIAGLIAMVATIISPWLLLHFIIVLPEERVKMRGNPLLYLIYLPAAITLLLLPIFGYANEQPLPWFRSLRIFEYGFGFFAVAVVTIFSFFKYTSPRTYQQMKIVLISCLIALVPLILFNILPQAIWEQPIIPAGSSILFLVFIPLGIGYAMVTQKLMDIDIVIRRGVIYGLVTMIMVAILSTAVFFTINFRSLLNPPEIILITLALGIIAAILFGPVKKGIEILLDKLLYKDRYDYRQIIKSLTLSLNSNMDRTDVSRLIVGTTVNTLNLVGGCLFTKTQSDSYELKTSQGKFDDNKIQKQLINLIPKRTQITEFPNSASSLHPDLAFILPLVIGEKEVGILCLSQKTTRQDFSSDDLYLLQEITSIAALELHSAKLVHDVNIRDTFISVASHELRTPLTSIIGYTDLLLRRNPEEATKKRWLNNVLDNSNKVGIMVDNLLNVSRIQSGRINLKKEKVKVIDILEEILVFVRESTDRHEFRVNIQDDLPSVFVDRDKFTQVVGNIIDNAIKYSPMGGRIMLSGQNHAKKDQVIVSITDDGIGISQADQQLLFTSFYRIQRPETQGIKGSGLGLYIAKKLIEAMGGKIWMTSELKQGSTFYISVPTGNTAQPSEKADII